MDNPATMTAPFASHLAPPPPGSSTHYLLLYLDAPKRQAIAPLLALHRDLTQVAHTVSDPHIATQKLLWWEQELRRAAQGQANHPTLLALCPLLSAQGIGPNALLPVIEACHRDVQQSRFMAFADLAEHCSAMSGTIAELASQLIAPPAQEARAATLAAARQLGLALQLVHIVRHVGRDAQRGRIYLPVEDLQRFDVKAQEILARQHSERFVALMRFQAERIHTLFDQAIGALPVGERKRQKPALIMASIQQTLLREIAAHGFAVLHERVALTPLRKFWLAWKMQALGRF